MVRSFQKFQVWKWPWWRGAGMRSVLEVGAGANLAVSEGISQGLEGAV